MAPKASRDGGSGGRFDINDVADADLRKSIFRDMAKSLVQSMREGAVTDRPGSIARLMEHAFRAGVEVAKSDRQFDSKDRLKRKMTEQDIPRLSREALRWFRYGLSGGHETPQREPLRAAALVLFMKPKVPGFPSTVSKDEWLMSEFRATTLSNKIIGPLEKLKLIDCQDLESGWRIGTFNEWGFELLMTGQTSFSEDRSPRGSSTASLYGKLLEEKPIRKAAIALGLAAEEPDRSPKP